MPDPISSIVPGEGALLSLPVRQGKPRQTWMTRGVMSRSQSPQPGVFSFYTPDFFLDEPMPWLIPEGVVEFSDLEHPRQNDSAAVSGVMPGELEWQGPLVSFFEECFHDLQALFESGRLTKAVPIFFEQAAFSVSPDQLDRWISILLRVPETLTPYGRWSAQEGILGASPELLFEIRDGILHTMALAGTLSAPETADSATVASLADAFIADPKESREHRLVIEGIIDSLAPFGTVSVGATSVLKLPTLWHLQTPIRVTLRETPDFDALVRRLHPTPALGGSPREASLQWLRQQDRHQQTAPRRGHFGAPFGAQMPDGSAFCLVAVRNLMWDTDMLRIGAGCGVIHESRMEREWEELRQKRNSVKRLFGLP